MEEQKTTFTVGKSLESFQAIFEGLASHKAEFDALRNAVADHLGKAVQAAFPDDAETQEALQGYFWACCELYILSRSSDPNQQAGSVRAVEWAFKGLLKDLIRVEPFARHVLIVYKRIKENSLQMAMLYDKLRHGKAGTVPQEFEAEKNAPETIIDLSKK
jgi:hypothetical protein